jgi:monoamine oxidase
LCKRALWINQTSDNGQAASRQSYLGQLASVKGGGLEKYWTETEVYRCRGGNQQIATKIVAALGPSRVHLRQPVTSLAVSDRGVVVTTAAAKYEADYAVLAVPPATWNRIAFTPRLHVSAVPQMGSNVKFLMTTKDLYWRASSSDPTRCRTAPCTSWHTAAPEGRGAGVVAFRRSASDCAAWTPPSAPRLSDALKVYPAIARASSAHGSWTGRPTWVRAPTLPRPGVTTLGRSCSSRSRPRPR